MAYDEELLRRQFYWNLFESYLTNTNGNSRLDLLLMMNNVAAFSPDLLNIPLYDGGPAISLKQADLLKPMVLKLVMLMMQSLTVN